MFKTHKKMFDLIGTGSIRRKGERDATSSMMIPVILLTYKIVITPKTIKFTFIYYNKQRCLTIYIFNNIHV